MGKCVSPIQLVIEVGDSTTKAPPGPEDNRQQDESIINSQLTTCCDEPLLTELACITQPDAVAEEVFVLTFAKHEYNNVLTRAAKQIITNNHLIVRHLRIALGTGIERHLGVQCGGSLDIECDHNHNLIARVHPCISHEIINVQYRVIERVLFYILITESELRRTGEHRHQSRENHCYTIGGDN